VLLAMRRKRLVFATRQLVVRTGHALAANEEAGKPAAKRPVRPLAAKAVPFAVAPVRLLVDLGLTAPPALHTARPSVHERAFLTEASVGVAPVVDARASNEPASENHAPARVKLRRPAVRKPVDVSLDEDDATVEVLDVVAVRPTISESDRQVGLM